jgi:Cd2+/Zn2+-exporting ATPase
LVDISPTVGRIVCPVDGEIEEKPIAEVPVGAMVLVRPGEKIPLDGVVAKGTTTVNQAPITGESAPVSKGEGDQRRSGQGNMRGCILFHRLSDYI